MADRGGFQRQEVITYAYLLLYIALSSGQIFFNKWVLSSKEINFPYPLGLTLLHMVFSSLLGFLLTKVFKGGDLISWVRRRVCDGMPMSELFDKRLDLSNKRNLHEMNLFLKIALFCTSTSPVTRPTMKEVAAMMIDAREAAGRCPLTPTSETSLDEQHISSTC